MLKYVNTMVTFSEVPDEISLCIEISNCPCHCMNCHSSYLAEDIGEELTLDKIYKLIDNNEGITCICFMGGDSSPKEIDMFAGCIKDLYDIKVAWYSGKQELSKDINLSNFNYVKLGPYIEELGPLNSKTTNQRFYKVERIGYEDGSFGYELNDITYKFHGKKD